MSGLINKGQGNQQSQNAQPWYAPAGINRGKVQTVSTGASPPQTVTDPWPDPTPDMLLRDDFEAIWQIIKKWDINVPDAYHGYCGATGNHVRAILDALDKAKAQTAYDKAMKGL